MTPTPQMLLEFWIDEVGRERWYESSPAIDREIRDRFGKLWEAAASVGAAPWTEDPEGTLASAILLDQFPRNMFRGEARAFVSDPLARQTVREAIAAGHDLDTALPQRQFFYVPLEHSEDLDDLGLAVRLMDEHCGIESLRLHFRAHREIIRRFGRYPFRNAALGRETTPDEQAFLDAGGYGAIVRELKA